MALGALMVIIAGFAVRSEGGDSPFAEQLQAMRKIGDFHAEIAETIGAGDSSRPRRITFLAKGRYWRRQDAYLADDGKSMMPNAGTIMAETKSSSACLELSTGVMLLSRRDPTTGKFFKGRISHEVDGVEPCICMFNFLSYRNGDPSSPALDWADLWDEKLIAERLKQLTKGQRDDGHGGVWVTVPFTTPQKAGAAVDDGAHHDIHVESPADLNGMHVITEILTLRHADSGSLVNRRVFTYRLVRIGSGPESIPLAMRFELFTGDAPGVAEIRTDVVSIDCSTKVKDAELEIDPNLAKDIHDISTGKDVDPER
jgi:hypothetical protein